MSLITLLAEIEARVGTFSTYQTTAGPSQNIPFNLKPAQQFLTKLGVCVNPGSPLSKLPSGVFDTPYTQPVVINNFEDSDGLGGLKFTNTRINRLLESAKTYVNTDIIPKGIFANTITKKNLSEQYTTTSNATAVGICHVQEIDLLTQQEIQNKKAIHAPRIGTISENTPALLLLSCPTLNFENGTANSLSRENQIKLIMGMYRNLFNATLQENRQYITMQAAGLNVFCGDAANLCFEILMRVANEFPQLNIIYHPEDLEFEFDAQFEKFNPINIVKAQKDVLFIANELTQIGYPCAFHNPSDSAVVYGQYDIGKKWKSNKKVSCTGEEHIGAMTTAPINSRGLNPNAYEHVVETSFINAAHQNLERPKSTVYAPRLFKNSELKLTDEQQLNDTQLHAIKMLIDTLNSEIQSYWPYPNKELKMLKVQALEELIKFNKVEPLTTSLNLVEIIHKKAFDGFFNSRTADLLADLVPTQRNNNQI